LKPTTIPIDAPVHLPPDPVGPDQGNLPGYKWKVLSTVIFGIFMVILDLTVVNVAFQTLRVDFGGNLGDAQWIISIYVMALGISTPLSGYLSDRFGEKKIYLGGLGLFALGSLLCGLSPSLGFLIASRTVQGLGGGIALPLGIALLLQAFPVEEHGLALGIFGIAGLVAPAIGPIIGGWLVDQSMWRVIFFINPPIGLVGVLLGMRFLRGHAPARRPALDAWGIVTEIIGFGAILYAASIASVFGWTSQNVLIWFGVGMIGLVAFGMVELFVAREPLLDLRLFSDRIFLNANLLGYVSTVALFGAEFLLPIYLQALRGVSALQTGLILLPMAITGGIFVILSGRLYDMVGPRPLMVVGFAFLMLNTWQLSQIQADTTVAWILVLLTFRGIALGLTVQTTLVTALSVVRPRDLPRGSSLINATRNVVQSIGVAMLASILASTLSPQVAALQNQLDSPLSANGHPPAICQPVASSGLSSLISPGNSSHQAQAGTPPISNHALSQQACDQNIAGFELAYKVTFYLAFVALLLGAMLPGWPAPWRGRNVSEAPPFTG
jgi:EmrB/QacA subfamily drug resistance transporter